MFDGADTIVLYDELALQEVLPLLWRALPQPVDRDTAAGYMERNARLLQAREAMDQLGPVEKQDENSPHSADLMRLELKVNLLLDLVGQILASNRPRPAPVPVRFNAQGVVWRTTGALPEAGAQGVVEIFLHDCIAEPLRLPGRVTNVTPDGHVKVRFTPVGDTVADLLEKLAFRRHRRQIAGSRNPRRGP
jgi:atypical PilZ domain-containing cyclic di-GMP receptor